MIIIINAVNARTSTQASTMYEFCLYCSKCELSSTKTGTRTNIHTSTQTNRNEKKFIKRMIIIILLSACFTWCLIVVFVVVLFLGFCAVSRCCCRYTHLFNGKRSSTETVERNKNTLPRLSDQLYGNNECVSTYFRCLSIRSDSFFFHLVLKNFTSNFFFWFWIKQNLLWF